MNYDGLFSFAAFAEDLNFTRAARRLHISQPALHAKVKRLADAVGVPLYRRVGRTLTLTLEGQRLLAYAREVSERETDMLAEVRGETLAGPVVIGAGRGALVHLLGPALRRFARGRRPLRVLTLPGPEAVAAVERGQAHLAVCAESNVPPTLDTRALRSVGQHVVVKKSHPLAARTFLRGRDLRGEPLVLPPPSAPHRRAIEQALAAVNAEVTVGVEASEWDLMLGFAQAGLGAAVVNDFCRPPRGCVAVPLRGLPVVDYVVASRSYLPPAVRDLADLLVTSLADD